MQNLLRPFESSFSKPTFQHFQLLVLGAILTVGSRTVCNILRTLSALPLAHSSTFHRFFSRRKWSLLSLARVLSKKLISTFYPDGVIPLVADDTVVRHKGARVFGKGCHRDPVRSSHALVVRCWGHKWIVVALRVQLPFAKRPWAVPLLVALYLAPKETRRHKKTRAKSTLDLLRQLSLLLIRWFPNRHFVLAADGGYASHALARFASKRSQSLTLVTKFYPDANLFDLPTTRKATGRPPIKGKRHLSPEEVVRSTKRRRHTNVRWYGAKQRHISLLTDAAHWYKSGKGLVHVRWVHVKDHEGTHREEYFMCSDASFRPDEIVEIYTGRWSIETTFEEMRAYLGLESTREWCQQSVLRLAPCLFGLYSIVVLAFLRAPACARSRSVITWRGKESITFSDAITTVRRRLWADLLFGQACNSRGSKISSGRFRKLVLSQIAPAA